MASLQAEVDCISLPPLVYWAASSHRFAPAPVHPLKRMTLIPFDQIPSQAGGFNDLFRDYCAAHAKVARFFPSDYRQDSAYSTMLEQPGPRPEERERLVNVLQEQNRILGASTATFERIALLRKETTFAVVTGQQVGLFGGPLYTLLKTVTAVRLAAALKAKFPSNDFVPVFWIEGEDHDFAEMNHATVLDQEGNPVRLEYLPGGVMPERNTGPVGEMVFDDQIHKPLEVLQSALPATDFTPELLKRLGHHFATGKTFGQAFGGWMHELFRDAGIVLISPNDPALKKILSPLFVRELSEYPEVSRLVITRSAELEQDYHAQIKPRSVNLFMFHKGGRYLIEPREHDFSLKGTRHFVPKEEMLRLAAHEPHLFSPNVVLRPVAQDMLLPTVAYVAGPSEVAYHAQLGPVYEHFGVRQPVVYPRASASFVPERTLRLLEKYQTDVADLVADLDGVTAAAVEQVSEVKLDLLFADTAARAREMVGELRFALKEIDPTLSGPVEGLEGKLTQNLAVLKEKAIAAQKRTHETAVRQLERAHGFLVPGGVLQERALNPALFLNRYGPAVVERLLGELVLGGDGHQIIPV